MSSSEFHLKVSTPVLAVDLLAGALSLSKQQTKEVMQKGCVWLETGAASKHKIQRLRRAKKQLSSGMVLHCYYNEKVLAELPQAASLIEDYGDYSIWDKPQAMLSQGSKWGDHCTLYRYAERHLQPERPAFIVHRLDRAASGLMILAHKKSTASAFAQMFKDRTITKDYFVSTVGDFSKMIDIKNTESVLDFSEPLDGKSAISHFYFVHYCTNTNQSKLRVNIKTGRKHQIRRHLASLGFPVVGDKLYNQNPEVNESGLCLQASRLRFICPVSGEEIHKTISAKM